MNKNDIAQVEIVDLGTDGNGIGKVNGYTLFIKDTVPGDIVEAKVIKVKKNYGYAVGFCLGLGALKSFFNLINKIPVGFFFS